MPLIFTCPTCGGHHLKEHLASATVTSTIETIYETGEVDYVAGSTEADDGEVFDYACANCGFTIHADGEDEFDESSVNTGTSLAEWILENCPQPE